jgi:hypothetical protein
MSHQGIGNGRISHQRSMNLPLPCQAISPCFWRHSVSLSFLYFSLIPPLVEGGRMSHHLEGCSSVSSFLTLADCQSSWTLVDFATLVLVPDSCSFLDSCHLLDSCSISNTYSLRTLEVTQTFVVFQTLADFLGCGICLYTYYEYIGKASYMRGFCDRENYCTAFPAQQTIEKYCDNCNNIN